MKRNIQNLLESKVPSDIAMFNVFYWIKKVIFGSESKELDFIRMWKKRLAIHSKRGVE